MEGYSKENRNNKIKQLYYFVKTNSQGGPIDEF
ncbi:hypothetical protein CLFO_12290 [Clostridium formicaceticum]|uniref:Uncharacterized protein n=1 Tax=Clostridium formicaceticum TaxID=1497 RepID=A0AAC9WFJ9_9CLOT|nr:hypothetical protein CLFO_12290 [Clostridium formicaceticum]